MSERKIGHYEVMDSQIITVDPKDIAAITKVLLNNGYVMSLSRANKYSDYITIHYAPARGGEYFTKTLTIFTNSEYDEDGHSINEENYECDEDSNF